MVGERSRSPRPRLRCPRKTATALVVLTTDDPHRPSFWPRRKYKSSSNLEGSAYPKADCGLGGSQSVGWLSRDRARGVADNPDPQPSFAQHCALSALLAVGCAFRHAVAGRGTTCALGHLSFSETPVFRVCVCSRLDLSQAVRVVGRVSPLPSRWPGSSPGRRIGAAQGRLSRDLARSRCGRAG